MNNREDKHLRHHWSCRPDIVKESWIYPAASTLFSCWIPHQIIWRRSCHQLLPQNLQFRLFCSSFNSSPPATKSSFECVFDRQTATLLLVILNNLRTSWNFSSKFHFLKSMNKSALLKLTLFMKDSWVAPSWCLLKLRATLFRKNSLIGVRASNKI